MDILLLITSVIIILFGVLQIILFFKVWGMTNNTRKIKNTVVVNEYPTGVSPAKIEFALGNVEKAQQMANREFVCDVYKVYSIVAANKLMDESQEYTKKFDNLEREYRDRFDSASSFIEFTKFSSFEKAKKVFG